MIADSSALALPPGSDRSRGALRWARRRLWHVVLASCLSSLCAFAGAENTGVADVATPQGVTEWLARLRDAATVPAYVGTFVVTSDTGAMSSARIWHRWDGSAESERVDALSGPPRTIFRHDDRVVLFLPRAHLMRTERRRLGWGFPNLARMDAATPDAERHYEVRLLGEDRVAGLDADVIMFEPRDDLRFAYRVWSEKKTGLMLKSQIIDVNGRVLEQAAFSEIDLNPSPELLNAQLTMPSADGLTQEAARREVIQASDEGWALATPVAGFEPQVCYRKSVAGVRRVAQCVFSDGLATVSLFMQPYDEERELHDGTSVFGATHVLRRRWPDPQGAWWVTSIGEAPEETLVDLIGSLQRTTP